jgi:asparagine synthase (glutamine-hydrolysing)
MASCQSRLWKGERQLLEAAETMEDLVDPATVRAILSQHASGEDRTRSVAFLLTMARWKQALSSVGGAS